MPTSRGRARGERPHVLILVQNLPVPFDRRVWQEALALVAAGYDVHVVCPRTMEHLESQLPAADIELSGDVLDRIAAARRR